MRFVAPEFSVMTDFIELLLSVVTQHHITFRRKEASRLWRFDGGAENYIHCPIKLDGWKEKTANEGECCTTMDCQHDSIRGKLMALTLYRVGPVRLGGS